MDEGASEPGTSKEDQKKKNKKNKSRRYTEVKEDRKQDSELKEGGHKPSTSDSDTDTHPQSCTMPAGGRRFSDMEMLVGMEDTQVNAARSRAGSCVEFYSIKVRFLCVLFLYS